MQFNPRTLLKRKYNLKSIRRLRRASSRLFAKPISYYEAMPITLNNLNVGFMTDMFMLRGKVYEMFP